MQTHKDLIVWNKSIELTVKIYKLTTTFPSEERFDLVSQIRRSTVSIPSNIAEGYARRNPKENAHFASIAYGSATELETQLFISKKLNFISQIEFENTEKLLEEILKLLYNYRKYLQNQK